MYESGQHPLCTADMVRVVLVESLPKFPGRFRGMRIEKVVVGRLTLHDSDRTRRKLWEKWRQFCKESKQLRLLFPISVNDCHIVAKLHGTTDTIVGHHLVLDSRAGKQSATLSVSELASQEGGSLRDVRVGVQTESGAAQISAELNGIPLRTWCADPLTDGTASGRIQIDFPSIFDKSPMGTMSVTGSVVNGRMKNTPASGAHSFSGRFTANMRMKVSAGRLRVLSGELRSDGRVLGADRFSGKLHWDTQRDKWFGMTFISGVPLARTLSKSLTGLPVRVASGRGDLRLAISGRMRHDSGTGRAAFTMDNCDGRCRFRNVSLRVVSARRLLSGIAGVAEFEGLVAATSEVPERLPVLRNVTLHFTPNTNQIGLVSMTARRHTARGWKARVNFRDASLVNLSALLKTRGSLSVHRGKASGHFELPLSLRNGQWVVNSHKVTGSATLTGAEIQPWSLNCSIAGCSCALRLAGNTMELTRGRGYLGKSLLTAEGFISRDPEAPVSLTVESDDLRLCDLSPWLIKETEIPKTSQHTQTRASIHIRGTVKEPTVDGRVVCLSLPVSEPLLGETLTTNITLDISRSPLKSPRVIVREETLRINIAEGLNEVWKRLMPGR